MISHRFAMSDFLDSCYKKNHTSKEKTNTTRL